VARPSELRPALHGTVGTRRSAYGSNPVLGLHGNRAREEILDAAWTLFGERGYHGTTVEAIGTATGRSGASVYQYFANKNELFLVFVYDLGTDLLRHATRLGELESGARGFDELRSWLDGTAAILQRHATTFRLWTVVEQAEHTLVEPAYAFLQAFSVRLAPRLAVGDLAGADPYPLALAILRMTERAYFLADTWATDLPTSDLTDGLARLIHLTLFPSAGALFEADPIGTSRRATSSPRRAATSYAGGTDGTTQRRAAGPRSKATVDKVLTAAAKVLGDKGFEAASVPDIVAAAGVGHGTFYSYWADLAGIFAALSITATAELDTFVDAIEAGPATTDAADTLAWLDARVGDWLALVERHRGVLRVWSQEQLPTQATENQRAHAAARANAALTSLLARCGRAEVLPARESGFVLAGLLLNFPPSIALLPGAASGEQVSATLTYIVGRALFGLDVTATGEIDSSPVAD
jgi:AcrR family transcriptional regulator